METANAIHVILCDKRVHVQVNVERWALSAPTPQSERTSRFVCGVLGANDEHTIQTYALKLDAEQRTPHMMNLVHLVMNTVVGDEDVVDVFTDSKMHDIDKDVVAFHGFTATLTRGTHRLSFDASMIEASIRAHFLRLNALRFFSQSPVYVTDRRTWTELATLPDTALICKLKKRKRTENTPARDAKRQCDTPC